MSQQKIFAAVCIISALVVVGVSAEVTVAGCLQSLQGVAGSYGTNLQATALAFAQTMSKSSNFDIDGFTKEVNDIVSGYMNLASPQANLAPKNIFDSITALMGKELSLFTKYIFNTGLSVNSIKAGTDAMSSIMDLNTKIMGEVSADCIPGSS